MDNYTNNNSARRYKAHVSVVGTTQLHLRNPYIIAWWSAAFPGFGHLLLSKYLRGYALFMWEILVNNMAHINHAIMYSFTGNIGMAKEVLEPRWLHLYLPVYIFAIWDSYRTTVDLNKVFILAERENADFNSYTISALEINYLDKRRPMMAVIMVLYYTRIGSIIYPPSDYSYFHDGVYDCFCVLFECPCCRSSSFPRRNWTSNKSTGPPVVFVYSFSYWFWCV